MPTFFVRLAIFTDLLMTKRKRKRLSARKRRFTSGFKNQRGFRCEILHIRYLDVSSAIMMSTYTCITCRVAFDDPDKQRSHYKTDWHRYNLKRKVAELPPVSAENFNQRVLAQQAENAQQTQEPNYCTVCTKKFSTKAQYENHLHSKKHREAEAAHERKVQAEVDRLAEKQKEKGLDGDIIQCEKDLKNMALRNLQNQHSSSSGSTASGGSSSKDTQSKQGKSSRAELFDDDSDDGDDEYSDCDSDESWEGEALGLEQCLFCDHMADSLEENVRHMTKGHSFYIPDLEYLTDLEGLVGHLGEKVGVGKMCLWCNHKGRMFTTTKACQQHMQDKGHCKLLFDGDDALEYADFYDYRSSYPDYKPGDEDGEDTEEEVTSHQVESESYQLTLPSGCTVGHRSLMKYYKQKFPLVERRKQTSLSKVMAHYKALGWTGNLGPASVQRAKDLGYLQRMKQRHQLKMSVKQNKFQPHLRPQVVF